VTRDEWRTSLLDLALAASKDSQHTIEHAILLCLSSMEWGPGPQATLAHVLSDLRRLVEPYAAERSGP
jgi:hypothetical protein